MIGKDLAEDIPELFSSSSYPLFESLHTLDLHESPVTYCDYITEPNAIFYQHLLQLQSKQTPKRSYSQQVSFNRLIFKEQNESNYVAED